MIDSTLGIFILALGPLMVGLGAVIDDLITQRQKKRDRHRAHVSHS